MSQNIFLPSYSIGAGIYKRVPEICKSYGKTAVVIGGHISLSKAKPLLVEAVGSSEISLLDFIWYGGDSTRENIEMLKANSAVQKADMIFAVGGGKSMDTSKALGDMLEKPVFTFPTIASNCAPVTSLCILYGKTGVEFYDAKRPAVHCFMEMDIMCEAPLKYLRAGIGDALAKQYEVCFNARGKNLDHTNTLGVQIAKNCSEQLIQYGVQAFEDAKIHKASEALKQVMLTIIVNTGLVSVLVEVLYNSSLAHSLYLARVKMPKHENHMHGEIVSFGILLLLIMDDRIDEAKRVYKFNKALGLPLSLADLEVEDIDLLIDLILEDKCLLSAPYEVTASLVKVTIEKFNNKILE